MSSLALEYEINPGIVHLRVQVLFEVSALDITFAHFAAWQGINKKQNKSTVKKQRWIHGKKSLSVVSADCFSESVQLL